MLNHTASACKRTKTKNKKKTEKKKVITKKKRVYWLTDWCRTKYISKIHGNKRRDNIQRASCKHRKFRIFNAKK